MYCNTVKIYAKDKVYGFDTSEAILWK